MKKLYTILGAFALIGTASAQTIFSSNLSTWAAGDPIDMIGAKTSIESDSLVEISTGAMYGTSLAQMINIESGHKRLTTQPLAVVEATSYDIEIYAKGKGDLRTGIFDGDLDGNDFGYQYGGYMAINSATTTMYTQQMTADTTTTAAEFIISVRNTVAANGHIQIDSIIVKVGITAPPTTVSVYDIQNSTGASPYENQTVMTGGIVTHVRADGKYYIKSGNGPFSGIYVFDDVNIVTAGDSVTFTAEVDEFYDLTELKSVTDFTNVSSGNFFFSNPITTAQVISEEYESVLVSICGQATSEEGQYQDWTINDGSGVGNVDNYAANYHPTGTNITPPVIGNSYEVKGIVDYSFSEFKILPRNAADVSQTAQCVVSVNENEVIYNVYPNPTENVLNIDVEGNHTASIVDLNGRTLNTMVINGFTSINVANLSSGVYFVNIDGNMTKFIKR
jgi:hypothetical protein